MSMYDQAELSTPIGQITMRKKNLEKIKGRVTTMIIYNKYRYAFI